MRYIHVTVLSVAAVLLWALAVGLMAWSSFVPVSSPGDLPAHELAAVVGRWAILAGLGASVMTSWAVASWGIYVLKYELKLGRRIRWVELPNTPDVGNGGESRPA